MNSVRKLKDAPAPKLSQEALEANVEEQRRLLLDEDPPKHEDGEGPWLISYADLMTLLMGFFALMTSMASFENQTFEEVGKKTAEYFGGEVENPYEELGKVIEALIATQGLQDQVQITVTRSEIAVTFEGTLFFESGSVVLKDSARDLMGQIGKILESKTSGKKFLIEGHTDDVPISQGVIASNWELSSLRAGAVARLFEERGFKRENILTIGWGDTRPLAPNRSPSGQALAANQAKNRRVIMKIMNNFPL